MNCYLNINKVVLSVKNKLLIILKYNILFVLGLLLSYQAKADTWERIKSRGVIQICVIPDSLPFSSDSDKNAGIHVDLAKLLAKNLEVDLELVWILYRFHARRAKCDALMETIIKPRNDESEDGDGVRPLTEASTGAKKSKKGPPLKTLAYARMELVLIGEEENINKFKQSKFESLKIGAMQGSWAHMLLQKININPRTANRTEQSLISAVNKGNVDVAFVSAAHYDWFKFQNDNSKIKFTKDFNLGEDLDFNVGMILRNSDQILLDKVNIFIKESLRKNSIKYIFNKYGVRYVLPNS